MRQLLHSLALLAVLLIAGVVRAEPQGHAALRAGVCGVGDREALWQDTRFCGSVVGDLLLFRHKNRDFGLGPYLEVGTAGLWDARFGGGASLLLPVTENFPLVLSLGLYDHALEAPSLAATLFWGARSYNFDGVYNWAFGLYASGYRDLDANRESLVSIGVEVDGFFVAAPFIFAIQALR